MGTETYAIRIHGENDLRLEKFELPELKTDEILVEIITNSICLSSYKAAKQGSRHKRIPENISEEPTIVGHEFGGVIIEVGEKYKDRWYVGQKCTIQPAINYKNGPVGILSAPGYTYRCVGGNATKVILPKDVLLMDCLLDYSGDAYYKASLAEPMSCIIGAAHAHYHIKVGCYNHINGIIEGGNTAILGGAGPMGLGAISYFINGPRKPDLIVVTDIDEERLNRAKTFFSTEDARSKEIKLVYINPDKENVIERVHQLTNGKMMHDVFVYVSAESVVEQGQKLLGFEGTLNFFAGPSDPKFSANFNFYDVHYNYHKVAGTSGGNTEDLKEALKLMSDGIIDPSFMISHVGGLNAGVETIMNLPNIPGGKKLLYTHIKMPLTAIDDFERLSNKESPFKNLYKGLASIVKNNNNLWCTEAEQYILKNAPQITL
ncbi:zinc-binding dehydrogenase [candidate division KSB1 bacterium]